MSRETRRKKKEHFAHDYEKIEHSVEGLDYYYLQCRICKQVVYPLLQLQKLTEYSKKHQYMFLQDWALALLYSQPMPMIGITSFMKQLFLVLMEFAPENGIPTENPGFRGYKFGPYSERIEDVIVGIEEAGLIEASGRKGTTGEYFSLTQVGKQVAEKPYAKLTPEQQKRLQEARLDWHQLGVRGLLNYIYRKYPDLAEESMVRDEVLRVLHKRRVGRLQWVDEE